MKQGRDRRYRIAWLAALLALAARAAEPAFPPLQWRAVPAEELAMTEEPLAPGASAVYLYTELNQRPARGAEQVYRQVKVLTEAGRDYANITVRYRPRLDTLSDIEARVIQPDGTIVPFTGKIFDRELSSGSGIFAELFSVHAKTLALPDVRVGSIIEYRYTIAYAGSDPSQFNWLLTQELFTREARFTNRPIAGRGLRLYVPRGWPRGARPAKLDDDGTVRMEVQNLPAFAAEESMPPAPSVVQRVDFIYSDASHDPAEFWPTLIKRYHEHDEKFLEVSSALRRTAASVTKGLDGDEPKARAIYAYVQQLKNTDIEGPLDEKEKARRARFADDYFRLADVGRRGYGDSGDLIMYCIGLLRAAGLQAQPVLVGGRGEAFFDREAMRPADLNAVVAGVRLAGREVLLDPSIPFLPFGSLSWFHTATDAVKLDANGGQWIATPAPVASDATTHREAALKLSNEGILEGFVTVTHTGHRALGVRMAARNSDAKARNALLEDELKAALPESAEVKVVGQPDWSGIGTPFQVRYQVKVSNWALASGPRLLVSFGLFGAGERKVFLEEKRQHPIYFGYPFEVHDELRIEYPSGYHLEHSPLPPPPSPEPLLGYSTAVAEDAGAVVMRRGYTVGVVLAAATSYQRFRDFFKGLRSGDEQQVVLAR